jgi:hypothetical protein
MGSINALPNYTSYFGLPENGNASTGIVFAIFQARINTELMDDLNNMLTTLIGWSNVRSSLHLDDGLVWANVAHVLWLSWRVHCYYSDLLGAQSVYLYRRTVSPVLFRYMRPYRRSPISCRDCSAGLPRNDSGNVQHFLQRRTYLQAKLTEKLALLTTSLSPGLCLCYFRSICLPQIPSSPR